MEIKYMLACIFTSMGPAKNERISNVFRILGARSAEKSEGIMGANAFAPTLFVMSCPTNGSSGQNRMRRMDSLMVASNKKKMSHLELL